jgi:2'-5' RNA ligase
VRAFLAVELPNEVKTALGQLESTLRPQLQSRASWVRPENAHITMRFLGNIEPEVVGVVHEIVRETCQGPTPIALSLSELGVFPTVRNARVLWCGITGQVDELNDVQKALEAGIRTASLPPENKRWSPHVTLARFREVPDRARLKEMLDTPVPTRDFVAKGVTLFASELHTDGAHYQRLIYVPFT